MNSELLDALEEKVATLMSGYKLLKEENRSLKEENDRLIQERDGFKGRIDMILKKLEGI